MSRDLIQEAVDEQSWGYQLNTMNARGTGARGLTFKQMVHSRRRTENIYIDMIDRQRIYKMAAPHISKVPRVRAWHNNELTPEEIQQIIKCLEERDNGR